MVNSVTFQDKSYVPVGASVGISELDGEQLVRVVKPEENTEPDVATYARLLGSDFHDGVIELDVRARLMHWADVDCRGFIGIVFRASEANDRFEGFYVRPRNGRSCTDPRRRIHTMQYFSYPGYTFAYFRERGIADYEAKADIEMDEWIHLKAEVEGAGARFYVDDMETPALVVDGLFGGADARGGVGLYVDNGTEGNFRNLSITYAD
ncbi:MAG: hypothetical protein UHS51_00270 [Atopobiaceae bacterium]|jgi:hypothetical protein|nr:hypothetical protein [Atopobiaceae bacterium]